MLANVEMELVLAQVVYVVLGGVFVELLMRIAVLAANHLTALVRQDHPLVQQLHQLLQGDVEME